MCVELCVECGEHPRAIRSKNPVRYRGKCRECLLKQRRQHRLYGKSSRRKKSDARTVDEEQVPWLDPDPISEWLKERQGENKIYDISKLCRVNGETLSRMLKGKLTRLSLDTVDKILVAYEAPFELGRLYPELYDDPSVFA